MRKAGNARFIPFREVIFIQTILVVQCASPGAVYLNGRFAGETDAERPLTLPVSPFGALILEFHPFSAGFASLSLRIPFSGGVPLVREPDSRMYVAVWPEGIVEVELVPQRLPDKAPFQNLRSVGGVRFSFQEYPVPAVLCESAENRCCHELPAGALSPEIALIPSGFLLSGRFMAEEIAEQYAMILSPDAGSVLLSVTGRNPTLLEGSGAVRTLRAYGDSTGHAALETWSLLPDGWRLTASEPMWLDGAPHRPETPEDTAMAAVEAAQLGLTREAESYFSPVFPCAQILARAAEYDGCVRLRRGLASGETAVGLTKLRENVLHVIPARFSAIRGGLNGAWQLTGMSVDE